MLTTLSKPEQSDCEGTKLKMNKAAAEVENRNEVIVFEMHDDAFREDAFSSPCFFAEGMHF